MGVSRQQPLSFDPIAQAAQNWTNAGWGAQANGMAFVTSIMRTHQILIARVNAALHPFKLSFARFEVLMLLNFTKAGALPLGKIGQRLQVHPASVTNAIDRLEVDGFVQRNRHPTDGRTTLAAITPAGRELVHTAVSQLNEDVFGRVGVRDDDVSTVVQMLAALRGNAGDFTTVD